MRIPDWLVRRLRKWADNYMATHAAAQRLTGQGPQDLLILRWDVFDAPGFHVRLHRILGSDDGRALHDHPWWNASVLLDGGYWEVVPDGSGAVIYGEHWRRRRQGDVIARGALARHRIVLCKAQIEETRYLWRQPGTNPPIEYVSAISLFLHGRNKRVWGFWDRQTFTPALYQRRKQ